MNEAQIRKLQNKVAKEVSSKFAEKEKQERALLASNLKEMTSEMKRLEALHPNRGACHCVWEGWVYLLRKGVTTKVVVADSDMIQTLERVSASPGKSYYMFSESDFKENKEFMDWVVEHYPTIKISLVQANKSEDAGKRLAGMAVLGGLYQDMAKKFPKRTPLDLRDGIQALDMLLSDGLKGA